MAISSAPLPRRIALYEQTYQVLRTSIFSGELAPGERLVETRLAQQLQVSRTPIRDALRQLQQDGLATVDAQGNMRVTVLSSADAAQLYDCRIALEQLSVAEACRRLSTDELQHLKHLFEQAEKADQRQSSNLSLFQRLDADYQFHRYIAKVSGNVWLVTLLDQIFDKMMLLRIQTTRHDPDVLEIRMEHHQIFDAIAQRQPEMAVTAIHAHLSASKNRVVEAVIDLQKKKVNDILNKAETTSD
ncbi:MAG: GntR family transcriptional regulator [Cyanobacteria bacterium J06631_12]